MFKDGNKTVFVQLKNNTSITELLDLHFSIVSMSLLEALLNVKFSSSWPMMFSCIGIIMINIVCSEIDTDLTDIYYIRYIMTLISHFLKFTFPLFFSLTL